MGLVKKIGIAVTLIAAFSLASFHVQASEYFEKKMKELIEGYGNWLLVDGEMESTHYRGKNFISAYTHTKLQRDGIFYEISLNCYSPSKLESFVEIFVTKFKVNENTTDKINFKNPGFRAYLEIINNPNTGYLIFPIYLDLDKGVYRKKLSDADGGLWLTDLFVGTIYSKSLALNADENRIILKDESFESANARKYILDQCFIKY